MALKVMEKQIKLERKKRNLESMREKDAKFETREKELEQAIKEATDEITEEEQEEVEKQVDEFLAEKDGHEKAKGELEREIEKMEKEISEEEERAKESAVEPAKKERKKEMGMEKRNWKEMGYQEREAFVAHEDVNTFLQKVRSCISEKRALTNVGLTIPDIMLPMIRQIATETSKLMKYVTVRQVSGTSRQNIMGEIPEAYWDEMCASLKEMDIAFYNMEMDGFKVSGYFAVCNAILEDSDISLSTELLNAIGKAIGKAIDKAILYGKNVKMPMGIVTSLLMKTAFAEYPTTGREWEDLSTSHVITGATASGTKLFQNIVTASGVIENDYNTDGIVWLMNKKTHAKLIAESMGVNAAAAITAGMSNSMPVIGGNIEEIKFIPDDTIIFGYFKNYTLVERAGTKLDQSEHVRFLEDQTVFRGTARYDGDLTIREAFAIYGIGKAPNTAAPKFAGEAAEA